MAVALQVPLEKFGDFALQANRRIQISSMCTVFAESEATSLMARGETPANIAMGLHLAIVSRTLAMLRRVGVTPPVLFAGGVAHNPCIKSLLEESLGEPVLVPGQPDLVGALGAVPFVMPFMDRNLLPVNDSYFLTKIVDVPVRPGRRHFA